MNLIEKEETVDLDTHVTALSPAVDETVLETLNKLVLSGGTEHIYRAADPGYPGNFSRDSIIAASLGGDIPALRAQVDYSAQFQGKKEDALTGEEPGKIHHELPAVEFNGASTAFNACDTTALFLTSIATLSEVQNEAITEQYKDQINAGIKYVKRHVKDGLFYEDPKLAGADRFGLRVTYWKDSILNTRFKDEPRYPVVFTLAHFQNADALARIAIALRDIELEYFAAEMFKTGVEKLWSDDHFVTAIDADGVIDAPSTDSLYCLLHISPFILPENYAEKIQEYSRQLETKAGYRTGLPVSDGRDNYHTEYVWTHEQALIHAGAKRYGLEHVQTVSNRVVNFFDPSQELYPELVDASTYVPAGNFKQLWSVRAYQYFQNPNKALF